MRILEVCVDLDGGGIDRYLYNYCSRIKDIQFDFAVVENNKIGILEPKLIAMGCNIYRVPRQSNGIKQNYDALKKIMLQTKYDAVHIHLGYKSAVALLCAKNCGIRTRIVHAHIAFVPESFLQKVLRKGMTFITKRLATSLAACGNDAAKWVWGKKAFESGRVTVHNNAIQTADYVFSEQLRTEARKELKINDETLVVGHVGRICEQKNQVRLVEIFASLRKMNKNSVLLLVGYIEERYKNLITTKARELSVEDSVCFLGVRNDVKKLLNAFDVFVFTSLYEGLPFTLIETQCNGLPALSSDAVTNEVKVSECVDFLSLDASNEEWAQKAVLLSKNAHNPNAYQDVANAGYDIDIEAERLRSYYINCIKANKL